MMYLKVGIKNSEPIYIKTNDTEELIRVFRSSYNRGIEYFEVKDSMGLLVIIKISEIVSLETCFDY